MRLSMRARWMALVMTAVLVLLGSVLVACDGLGSGDDGTSSTDTTASGATDPTGPPTAEGPTPEAPAPEDPTPEEPAPAPAAPPTTLSTAEEVLPNGNIRALGYIEDVWVAGGTRYISINYVTMLTGAAADAAAIAAGEILPGEHVPNDYFMEDVSPRLREWEVAGSVVITTDTRWAPHDGFGASCTWADFLSFWGPGPLPDGDSHLHAVPWWIERDGETVVSISEQYIP